MYKNIILYLNTLNIYIYIYIYINKNKYIDFQGGAGWGKQNLSSSHHLPKIGMCRIDLVK